MITVITLAWNERVLMPFFLRHYEKFADLIVVNDNGSDDGTREIVLAHPKCMLKEYETNNQLKDSGHLDIKNNLYKRLKGCDWFIVVDVDEFVVHKDLRGYLEKCNETGVTTPRTKGHEMFGETTPVDDGITPLTDIITKGSWPPSYSKTAVFHKDVNINYEPGAHFCHPTGRVKDNLDFKITLLHYHWLSEEYTIDRITKYAARMSDENKKHGWGGQYLQIEDQRKFYRDNQPKAVTIPEIADAKKN